MFLSLLFAGAEGAISSLLSGAACALPSFLVIYLMIKFSGKGASPAGIFIYEFVKVSLIILGFLSIALFYSHLKWLPFIFTAIAVLLSHIFALASRN